MVNVDAVEILLVEDNPNDVELAETQKIMSKLRGAAQSPYSPGNRTQTMQKVIRHAVWALVNERSPGL